jgi:hypothetical protein
MLFCDPLFSKDNYQERRRIFSRMKLGYMPYRGAQRDRFIERVANYRRLDIVATAYNSTLWDMIDVPYTAAHNESIFLKCINKLDLASGSGFNQAFRTRLSLSGTPNDKLNINLNFDLSEDDLLTYEDGLNTLFFDHEYSLDVLAFVAALYRETLYYGKPDLAKRLRDYYALKLIKFCGRYGIGPALTEEIIDTSISRVLNTNHSHDLLLIQKLQAESLKANDELNITLESFLLFHQYLLAGYQSSK